jgi:LacI family transcriptional regulator, repressor for deo operon, udp, cdd, tsx, nupC, and nupG
VPDISNAFFAAIIRGIEKVAYENSYNVLLGDSQNDANRERAYAQLIASKQVDGLITLMPRLPLLSMNGRMPIVNASSYVEDDSITRVHIDNVAAAREATDLLIAMGHNRIALVLGNIQSPVFADRERGYRAALMASGIKPSAKWIASGDLSVEAGIAATQLLFSREPLLTAIFCANDEMALGAIKAIRSMGKSVPDDVSVIGFDDTPLAKFFDPPLTTVAQPSALIGEEAMRLLLEILNDPATPPQRRILSTQLIVRGSTARQTPPS